MHPPSKALAALLVSGVACRPEPADAPQAPAPAPAPASTEPTPSEPTSEPPSEGPGRDDDRSAIATLDDLRAGLELVVPSSSIVSTTGPGPALTACGAAGNPAVLSAERSGDLGPHAIGAPIWIVSPKSLGRPTITEIECHAETDDELASVDFSISAPVPSGPDSTPGSIAIRFALIGAQPSASARLSEAPPLTRDVKMFRGALARALDKDVNARAKHCDDPERSLPTAAQLDAAISGASLQAIRGRDGVHAFALVEDEITTTDCYGEPQSFAALIAPDGRIESTWMTNNGVTLMWVVDLDGNGTDEMILRLRWLEDSGEEIYLRFEDDDGTWDEQALYVSESP